MEENLPTSDEKLMAAVAHLFGPLSAIIVWATQKQKSRFVKFQSLQALAFDATVMVAMMAFFACFFSVIFLGIFAFVFVGLDNSSSPKDVGTFFGLPFMFPFMIFACTAPLSLLFLFIRLIAAVSVINGKNYHYPILGKWLDNFLEDK